MRAIEDAIPGTGKGEEKLSAIRAILEAVDSGAAKYWPQIQSVIGVLVGLFNKHGRFQDCGVTMSKLLDLLDLLPQGRGRLGAGPVEEPQRPSRWP
jgi:hypothetical protein